MGASCCALKSNHCQVLFTPGRIPFTVEYMDEGGFIRVAVSRSQRSRPTVLPRIAVSATAGQSYRPIHALGAHARDLLQLQRTAGNNAVVQRIGSPTPTITQPKPGTTKVGFIDNDDGSNIRTGPAESGGTILTEAPMPPATRVVVSGTHPDVPEWWYVTAQLASTWSAATCRDCA